ncbi:hypothetical protein AV521_41525 [Streptomyces sp. IMTB 2501]|uniref:LuxR C-terminal-related transcriptional regulator n=1 Tax=Streptomyces sp. IMTB 2501 TaxID=1776340 RepID=UPI00096D4175|nr:LuxR C-terminal-related transcriptional regulator [Streptomyces sp. IMTB 2501]OLZ62603.1 hypothetical protein AV521_41525 [Streptomyces sp. IMTB 2501]
MTAGDTDRETGTITRDDLPHRLLEHVYAIAAVRGEISRRELIRLADAPAGDAERAVDQLLRLRVLTASPEQADRLLPVAPATAYTQLLMPAMRELRDRQTAINDASAQLARLLPVYEDSVMRRSREQPLLRLDDVPAVRLAISELAARATREILTSQPGGPRPEAVLKEAMSRTAHVLGRGLRMRTLYQYAAQYHQPTVDHAALLVEHGGEVRVVNDAFMRLIVFDREVALIELADNAGGALMVHDPNVVRFLVRAFERAWDRALPFALSYERDQVLRNSEEMKTAIVELLVEGYDDKVVAKRLGISLRTFQRHLAEVLRRIGANNRLHAGYLLRDLGVLHDAYDTTPRSPQQSC